MNEFVIKLFPFLVAVGLIYSAIRRLKKQLATDAKPTIKTYLNEIGGYVVFGLVALIAGVVLLFEQGGPATPTDLGPDAPPTVHSQVDGAVAEQEWATQAIGDEPLTISTPKDWTATQIPEQPDDFLMTAPQRQAFLRVEVIAKGRTPAKTTQQLASLLQSSLTTDAANSDVKLEEAVTIDGHPATFLEVQTTIEGHPVVFAIYTVDLSDRWAEIRFWMPAEQIESKRTVTRRIAESLRLYPEDRMPGETAARQTQLHMSAGGLIRQGKLDEAIAKYTECIEVNRYFGSAYWGRGQAYAAKGDFEKAVADFDRVVLVEHGFSRLFNERGLALGRLGHFDRAIADFTESLRLDQEEDADPSDRAATLCNRSSMYLQTNRLNEGLADLDKAVDIAPEFSEAYYLRATLRDRAGQAKDALADLDAAIALTSEDYRMFYTRASILSTSNDAEIRDGKKAVADAQRACELTQFRDSGVIAVLAAAYAEVGQWDDARKHAATAIERASDARRRQIREFLVPIESRQPVRRP